MNALADLTITDASVAIHRREISARELVDAVLARAARTEPAVHAYSELAADLARSQADSADHFAVANSNLPPLHGIPIAVKDVFDVAGSATTAGSRALGDAIALSDAASVRALRESGAIIMGKAFAHEFGFASNVPPTRNAWDQLRAPGGSSAGSAVAVAVGSALGALGTDTGGSVRVPAALNGVVGFKPSFDAIDSAGTIRMSAGMDTVGILARTAAGTALLFDALARPAAAGRSQARPSRTELRLGFFGPSRARLVDTDILAAVSSAVGELVVCLRNS